jgi:hypothetical protein
MVGKYDANRFTGNVTIPGRPEMRLGFPVYIESLDCFYYVTSISHSYSPGSSFTTSLGLRAKRERFSSTDLITRNGTPMPSGGTLQLDENGVNRDEIGRDIGVPNVVMRPATKEEFRAKFAVSDLGIIGAYPDDEGDEPYRPENNGGYRDVVDNPLQRQLVWDDYRSGIGWNVAGGSLWVYDIDEDFQVQSLMWCPPESDTPPLRQDRPDLTLGALPVSDDSGYRLIGVFPYGRGLVVDDTGTLASPTGGTDEEGQPLAQPGAAAEAATQAVLLRNMTPDDQVEITVGQNTRASMGSGVLSEASVLKVDQTNSGESFTSMAPTDASSNVCSCTDNYTLDNLLLLQQLGGAFNDVFDQVSSLDQLFTDSYQVSDDQVWQHEMDHQRAQTGMDAGAVGNVISPGGSPPYSPSVNDTQQTRQNNR